MEGKQLLEMLSNGNVHDLMSSIKHHYKYNKKDK